jgi:Calcineurin-like phosphoesterase superfamily domain
MLFKDIAPVTCEMLGIERLQWLRQLPRECHEHDIAVLHASPHDLWRAPLNDASDDELRMTYGVLTRKSIVYGHVHRPFVRDLGEMTVANSGSVGLRYDGDMRASYVIVQDGAVRIRRVEYNVSAILNWWACFRRLLQLMDLRDARSKKTQARKSLTVQSY